MPRTNRIAKKSLSISLLGLLVTSTLALGETQKVTDLLSSGYEIKAAYHSPARVGTVHFLILQKGSSCSGQLIPDTALSFSSATAGASPLLN